MKKFLKYIHDGIFGRRLTADTVWEDKIAKETERNKTLMKELLAHKKRYKIKERPDGTWEIFRENATIAGTAVLYHWMTIHQHPYGLIQSGVKYEFPSYFPDFDTAEEYLHRLTNPQEVLYDACGNEIEE